MLAQLFKDKSQTIDFILMAIAAVIFIGGWLATQLRKMREQSGAARKPGERPPAALPQRLDDLAAKRQAELQKLAQQRRERRSEQPETPRQVRPENLKAEQLQQREHAIAQYQRRAESLHRDQQPQRDEPQEIRRPPAPSTATPTAETRRQPLRTPVSKRRPRRPVPPRQALERPQTGTVAPRRSPVSKTLGEGATQVVEKSQTDRPSSSTVFRRVADVADPTKKPVSHPRILRGSSLRNAFVLKEILDRPLSIRDIEEPA